MKIFNLEIDFAATPWWVWLAILGILVVGLGWTLWAFRHPYHTSPALGPEEVNSQDKWHRFDWPRFIGSMLLLLLMSGTVLGGWGNIQTSKNEELATRNVVLAMDCSRSMTSVDMDTEGKTTRIQYAIDDIVAALADAAVDISFGVFCYGSETVRVSPVTPDREFVLESVQAMSVSEDGGTLMGAGVQRSLDALAQAGGGMIVVVSDGAENVEFDSDVKIRFADAVQQAMRQGDVVSTVAYGVPGNINDPPDIEALQEAATQSGGFFAEAQKPGELAAALEQVSESSTTQLVTSALLAEEERWVATLILLVAAVPWFLLVVVGRR